MRHTEDARLNRKPQNWSINCTKGIKTYVGWGWYYLSTILDDFSRFIHDWELCTTMNKEDVMRCVDRAMEKAGIPKGHPPKLLSDNGPCYIAADLGEYLENQYGMKQVHGAPLHPQTQGKIERYHRSMLF